MRRTPARAAVSLLEPSQLCVVGFLLSPLPFPATCIHFYKAIVWIHVIKTLGKYILTFLISFMMFFFTFSSIQYYVLLTPAYVNLSCIVSYESAHACRLYIAVNNATVMLERRPRHTPPTAVCASPPEPRLRLPGDHHVVGAPPGAAPRPVPRISDAQAARPLGRRLAR